MSQSFWKGLNNKVRVLLWIFLIAAGTVILTLQVRLKLTEAANNLKSLEVTTEPVFMVTSAVIQPESWESWKSYYGQAKAVRTLDVTSYVREVVQEVLVELGDKIKVGQTVVTLLNADHAARALANKSEYDEALLNYNRLFELNKKGAIAQSEVDKAYSALKKSEADAQASRSTLQRTELKSTIDGVVSSRNVEPGEVAEVGKSLITIVDLGEMEAQLMVSKKDIHNINKDTPVEIVVDDVASKGRVKRISPEAQQGSGLYPVVVGLEQGSSVLPGSYLEGKFLVEKKDGVIVIPSNSVIYRNSKEYVYLTSGDRAKMAEVVTGGGRGGRVMVNSGLKPGDTLIISGNRGLFDGALISADKE